jgi:photosystem II stability/assembly factor-like uncharacterized protein
VRRLLTILCLLLVGCGSCGPEDRWETIELGTDAAFRDIFFLDARNGWMVGEAGVSVPGGIVARTRDGGATWKYQTKVVPKRWRASSVDLDAAHFTDEAHGVIAAESGVILRTVDGGETWDRVLPTGPVYAHNRDVEFIDARNGWIIGRQGVRRTEDGGETWRRVDEDLDAAGEALDMLDGARGWMVGKFGQVHRTEDGGVHWELVPALGDLDGLSGDEKPHLTSVHFVDPDHGWIAGYWREMPALERHDWAVIIHTSDGGGTWTRQVDSVEALLRSIRFVDRDRGWTVGFNRNDGTSVILATENGGATWAVQKTIYGEELMALEVCAGRVWTAGDRVREEPQRVFRLELALAGPAGRDQGVDERE